MISDLLSHGMSTTLDYTYGQPKKRKPIPQKAQIRINKPPRSQINVQQTRIGKDIELTNVQQPTKSQGSWWHVGTTQHHTDPTDFTWAVRTHPSKGGLDFGLKISGSTMPFTGRKRVFL